MTRDDHLDATAAALRNAAAGLRNVRDARTQLATDLARVEQERDQARSDLNRAERRLNEQRGANTVLARELGETRILLDNTRAALRQALDAARGDTDPNTVTDLRPAARLVPTPNPSPGCAVSPEDPQSATTDEGGPVSG